MVKHTHPGIMLIDRLETFSRQLQVNNNNVFYGAGLPSSPSNGDVWFEPDALYPQPWTYDSAESEWMSSPFFLDWGAAFFGDSGSIEKALPFYGIAENKIKLRQVIGFIRNTSATAHTGSNYLSFKIDSLFGTGLYTDQYIIPVDTGTNPSALGGNGVRRVLQNPNVWILGTAWTLRLVITETGTITGTCQINFGAYLQYARF